MSLREIKLLNHNEFESIWASTHRYAKSQGYKGYNKHDGLNSPILRLFLRWNRWARIAAIQFVMRFPINVRPILLTKKAYNPKGISLFVRSLLLMYEQSTKPEYLAEAEELLRLLIELKSSGCTGTAWGYHYPWQDPGFFAPTGTPNAVVTAFVCQAFLLAYRITKNEVYLEVVSEAIKFFRNDLTVLKDEADELCLAYMPLPMSMRVMDVSILIGSVIAQYSQFCGATELRQTAFRLVNYVVNRQTIEGAWFYTDPPSQSHIVHDNYHTGFILDALWEYMLATNDLSYMERYQKGLRFYAHKLFMPDGAPRWMSHIEHPYDIHGAAQGIITFSRHAEEYPGLAVKIAWWTIENLYSGKGYFFYQINRFFTNRFTLMRWCNSWMCFALSCFLSQNNAASKDI
jgi:uncharacterized protein YyaL (SSP411 family)